MGISPYTSNLTFMEQELGGVIAKPGKCSPPSASGLTHIYRTTNLANLCTAAPPASGHQPMLFPGPNIGNSEGHNQH